MVHLAALGRAAHILERAERPCTERPTNEDTEMKAMVEVEWLDLVLTCNVSMMVIAEDFRIM